MGQDLLNKELCEAAENVPLSIFFFFSLDKGSRRGFFSGMMHGNGMLPHAAKMEALGSFRG